MSGGSTMSNLPQAKQLDFEENIDLHSAPDSSSSEERLPDEELKAKLKKRAQEYLGNTKIMKFQCFALVVEDVGGNIIKEIESEIKVPICTEKLLEGSYIENVDASVAKYIFTKIIGYDNYFACPCIIIRDLHGDVVDIVKYRPHRNGYDNLPKYLYVKSANKPKNRGDFFLYPFQKEMERLIEKEGFVFVGEGIKNSVNALIRSVPFLSIESTSNVDNPKIIAYIKELLRKRIPVYAVMDGDKAGENALTKLNEKLGEKLSNLIDFDSNIDFTEYIKKEFTWE
jgi:hypothetical protein